MGTYTGKTVAIFYNSAVANYDQAIALWTIKKAVGSTGTVTLSDVQGRTGGAGGATNLDTDIAALVAGTYDDVWVLSAISDAGTTATLNYDQIAQLRAKLKTANQTGTLITSGTAQGAGGASDKIQLAATGSSTVNDYYNGLYVVITAGTGIGEYGWIMDYTGSTTVAIQKGGANWTATIDGTTEYAIYNITHLHIQKDPAKAIAAAYVYNVNSTYSTQVLTWYECHSTNDMPEIIAKTGTKLSYLRTATASAATATTLLCATASMVVNAYAGKYLYFQSLVGMQWAKITSNTADTFTCEGFNNPNYSLFTSGGEAGWRTTYAAALPTTITYYLVDSPGDIGALLYIQRYIKTYLMKYTETAMAHDGYTVSEIWGKLLDWNGNLDDHSYGPPAQDVNFMYGSPQRYSYRNFTMYTLGKAISDAIAFSVT